MEKNCYVDYSKFFQVAESEFSEFVKNIRYEEVEQAADLIQKAKEAGNRLHISGIGKPAHIAGYIASLMSSTGTPAYFLHGTEAVHGSCGQLKENDVVIFISNSGETAEMPGFYDEDEYDLAGFSVGAVDKAKVLDKNTMKPGDVIIGLASSGVHSNGFSLVRKVFDVEKADLKKPLEKLGGKSLGEALLTPTKIYVKSMLALFKEAEVKGVSHITGGGFYENIPRSIPDGLGAKIDKASVKILPIFDLIAEEGNIPEHDMFNTFNMGVGMSVVVAAEDAEKALNILRDAGEDAYVIGEIIKSDEKVVIC